MTKTTSTIPLMPPPPSIQDKEVLNWLSKFYTPYKTRITYRETFSGSTTLTNGTGLVDIISIDNIAGKEGEWILVTGFLGITPSSTSVTYREGRIISSAPSIGPSATVTISPLIGSESGVDITNLNPAYFSLAGVLIFNTSGNIKITLKALSNGADSSVNSGGAELDLFKLFNFTEQ